MSHGRYPFAYVPKKNHGFHWPPAGFCCSCSGYIGRVECHFWRSLELRQALRERTESLPLARLWHEREASRRLDAIVSLCRSFFSFVSPSKQITPYASHLHHTDNHIPKPPIPPPCRPAASPCIFSLTLTLTSKNFETQRSKHTDSPLLRSASR